MIKTSTDVATLAAGLGTALHAAGLPVGPDRCERLASALTVMGASTISELRACALATLVSDPSQMPTFERVFSALFGTPAPLKDLLASADLPSMPAEPDGGPPAAPVPGAPGQLPSGLHVSATGTSAENGDEPLSELPAVNRVASAPNRSIHSSGSTVLPRDLDIFLPLASRTRPCSTTVPNGMASAGSQSFIAYRLSIIILATQKNRMS